MILNTFEELFHIGNRLVTQSNIGNFSLELDTPIVEHKGDSAVCFGPVKAPNALEKLSRCRCLDRVVPALPEYTVIVFQKRALFCRRFWVRNSD